MSGLGVIILARHRPDHAARLAQVFAQAGCPVAVHLDRRSSRAAWRELERLAPQETRLMWRHASSPGGWGMVAASLEAAAWLLRVETGPGPCHVALLCESSLPLVPVPEILSYLGSRRGVDFIESNPAPGAPGTSSPSPRRGAGAHPRRTGQPWWCLSTSTLDAILRHPGRPTLERALRRSAAPEETFFQTAALLTGANRIAAPVTLRRSDGDGRNLPVYDDHADVLRRSGALFVQGVDEDAEALRRWALDGAPPPAGRAPAPTFAGHMPTPATAGDREELPDGGTVLLCPDAAALDRIAEQLEEALPGMVVHGRLFAPGRARLAHNMAIYRGNLTAEARLRDHAAGQFLARLVLADAPRRVIWCATEREFARFCALGGGAEVAVAALRIRPDIAVPELAGLLLDPTADTGAASSPIRAA